MVVRRLVWKYVGVSGPECRPKSGNKDCKNVVIKCDTVKIFWNESNKSKFELGGN
jgi:hypothetical protein